MAMNDITPSNAFDLLSTDDQAVVNNYVQFVEHDQRRKGERLALALARPVPHEMVKRSRGALIKPLVRAAIAERLQGLANIQDISPSRVIAEHAALAFSNMADYVQTVFGGEIVIDISECTREQMAAVKSIETLDTPAGRKTKITLYDKQPSLNALQAVMDMPLISDIKASGNVARIAAGDDAGKAYADLLEEMRP